MEVNAPSSAPGAALVTIPAGEYRIGSDRFYPKEAPSHLVTLAAFQIAPTPVTNAQFAAFVAASGYRTVSELPPDPALYPALYPGLSREQRQPASAVFRPLPSSLDRSNPIDWWTWRAMCGSGPARFPHRRRRPGPSSCQGWLLPLRRQLLHALSPLGLHRPNPRYRHLPNGVSLRR